MAFQNVQLDYQNFSFGPTSGRIYSIDHINSVMIVKTYPAGAFVTSYPLDTMLQNEVLELEYDGYYWWTLSNLGSNGFLGRVINKWKLNGSILEKQTGSTNEFNLLNTAGTIYESEAFCVQVHKTYTQYYLNIGVTQATLGNVEFLSIGDSIYLGPSTSTPGALRERTITGIVGNVVYFAGQPLDVTFNVGNQVIYRKNIWVFNNRNHLSTTGGSLIQINSYKGWILSTYSSSEWKHVTAATCYNGNLAFVRESQLLQYKPFGSNTGYQSSYHLSNVSADKTTIFDAVDIEMDSTYIYKLQKKRRIFNTITLEYQDEVSSNYEIDQELLTSKVTSVTAKRTNNSILFGANRIGDFTIKIIDQYNNPITGRSVSVQEDDSSGYIPTGYTSFNTNSNGEGNTRYNTGTAPTFRQPTITARDVATSLNVKISSDQLSNEDSIGYIIQQLGPRSTKPVSQQKIVSTAPVISQVSGVLSTSFMEQVKAISEKNIDQVILSNKSYLDQRQLTPPIMLIEQYGDISTFTNVQQYDFLIYASPLPYSVKNPVDTNILIRILGYLGTPLNPSTLIFKVNDINVTSSVVVTSFGTGLELFYNPPSNFPYSSTVSVFISIEDTETIPRLVSTYYTFDIVADYKKPILYTVYPPDNSINNLPETFIYGIIKDLETGINLDSIEMYVEGKKVNHITELVDNNTVKVSYQTNYSFPYESEVSVSIFVKDLEDNPLIGSWSFYIKQSQGVLFTNMNPSPCSALVPIDTNVCAEVYGLEEGVNLNTLSFNVDGKEVTYLLKPKILRTE